MSVARFKENPFLEGMIVPVKNRQVRLSKLGKDDNILINQDTGEVLGTHQGTRPAGSAVSLVVLHNISLPPEAFSGNWIERFFTNRLDPQAHPYFSTIAGLQVSTHFLVRRDGRVLQFVGCDRRAWHAGQSTWLGRDNCNDYSVGIELEGSDSWPFAAVQYVALWPLHEKLQARSPIRALAGHCHVAPGRKTDPGPYFDWAAARAQCLRLMLPAEVGG